MKLFKQFVKRQLGWLKLLVFNIFEFDKIKNADLIFILPYYHLGGAERVHLNIVKSFPDKKVIVLFTHLSSTERYLKSFKEVAQIVELNSIINKKNKYVTRILFKSIAQAINNSETVQTVLGSNTLYFYEILPYLKKNAVDLIHAFAPEDDRKLVFSNAADLLMHRIVITNQGKECLTDIYRKNNVNPIYLDRIKLIPNAVSGSRESRRTLDSSKGICTVGFIGRWSDEKRPELFLELARSFQNKASIQFVIAGSGMNEHRKKIQDAGIDYKGQINDEEEMNKLYNSLQMICITSIYEGFPMVVMEAMMHGVIPICTNVGGISEHIIDGQNGILIDNVNENQIASEMAHAIVKVKNDLNLQRFLESNAKNYAHDDFGMDQFQEAYRKLLLP